MDYRKIFETAMNRRPNVNVRAMGTVAALSIINLIISAVLFRLLRGSVFSFQALLIYVPAIAFAVFMFWLPNNRSVFLCIPVLLTFVCYFIGILMQQCDGWFKCFSIFMALMAVCLFVLTLAGILKTVFISVTASAAVGAMYILYALFNLVFNVISGIDGWHQNITANGNTVVGGIISGGTFGNLSMDIGAVAYLLPAAILFIEMAFTTFMLAESKQNN